MGGAVHVVSKVSLMLLMRRSNCVLAVDHSVGVSCYCFKVVVRLLMESAFCSKNAVVNASKLVWGMGLRMRGGFTTDFGGIRAISVWCVM